MLKFNAAEFARASMEFGKIVALLQYMQPDDVTLARAELPKRLDDLAQSINDLPTSPSFVGQLGMFSERANALTWEDREVTTALAVSLYNHLIFDLTQPLFLWIPNGRRAYFEQPSPPFGEAVADNLTPDANRDTFEAARCVAVDQWTAAVFHSMRVLEHGLRSFARVIDIDMTETVDQQNWNTIITQIENKITELQGARKSPEKTEQLQRWSEIASNFRYFKDAWRNHVMHSRSTYDETQAMIVYDHVRTFMHEVATAALA